MSDQEHAERGEVGPQDAPRPASDAAPESKLTRLRRVFHPAPIAATLVALGVGMLIGVLWPGDEDDSKEATHEHAAQDEATVWTCSMHPQVRSPDPGLCPICAMDLIPVSEGGEDRPAADEVALTPRAQALARIRTSPVRRASETNVQLRLLGRLDYDETQLRTVTAWTDGRIDRLHVATTGEQVRAGQVIATLYSPEIYAAHQDLLVATRQRAVAAAPTSDDTSSRAASSASRMVEAARQKLRLLGVPDADIERMEKADSPWKSVRIRSPFAGTVLERLVSEGNYVTAGTGLYRIADLDTLWVQLDAYEPDLARLQKGQSVELKVASFPGERFEGEVAFIDPVVDPARRTARVRVEVPNAEGRLRPGMFAEAIVAGDDAVGAQAPLVIPDTAPLFTGRRAIVYVEVPERDRPTYQAREVRLGPEMNGVYPVVAGLEEGERVVTHGAFTLDADLQIRGGESMMTRGDDSDHRPIDDALVVSDAFRQKLSPVVSGYLEIQTALADDDLERAKAAATKTKDAAGKFAPREPAEPSEVWLSLRSDLLAHLERMVAASTMEAARGSFEHVSSAVSTLLHRFGNPLEQPLRVAFCPMAFDNQGAQWIQAEDEIANAYFGARMLRCGEIRETVPQGGYLVPESSGASKAH